MAFYPKLKTTASEDILNIPLEALKIQPSTLSMIKNARVLISDGKMKTKYNTVGDVINFGKSSMMSLLLYKGIKYEDLCERIQDLEEGLARLGLKMKDSEFTVGDCRISALDVLPKSQEVLNSISKKIKTLDDLIVYGYDELEMYATAKSKKDIEIALEKFGLKMEGSTRGFKKQNRFPLHEYSEYLGDHHVMIDKKKEEERREKTLRREKVALSQDISLLNMRRGYVFELIKQKGFTTLKDIVEYGEENWKREITLEQLYALQENLARFGLKLKGSNYGIDRGKIIRRPSVEESEMGLSEKKINPIDAKSLLREDYEKFLDIKLTDVGFTKAIIDVFKKHGDKYTTIRDLISYPRKILTDDFGCGNCVKIVNALNLYNLAPVKALQDYGDKRIVDASKFTYNIHYERMKRSEKERFGNTRLEDLGFGLDMIKELKKVNPDLETFIQATFITEEALWKVGCPTSIMIKFFELLKRYGVSVDVKNIKPKSIRSTNQTLTKTNEINFTKEDILQRGIVHLGLTASLTNYLRDAGISTIGDLVQYSPQNLVKILNNNYSGLRKIINALSSFGLSLSEYNNSELKVSKAILKVNYNELNDNEKVALLNRPVADIGVTRRILMKLQNAGIKTIGELVEKTHKDLLVTELNNTNIVKIKKVLKEIGLDISRVYPEGEQNPQKERAKVLVQIDVMTLNEEDRAEFFNHEIREIGITELMAKRLASQNIHKIKDLLDLTYGQLLELGIPHSSVAIIKNCLSNYNLKLKKLSPFGKKVIESIDTEILPSVRAGETQSVNANDYKFYNRKINHLKRYLHYKGFKKQETILDDENFI